LAANIYLYYVFDLWAHQWCQRYCRGDVRLIRYIDDMWVGFEKCEEAEQFQEALRQRLAKFGLELHPEKTRLIAFGRFAQECRRRRGLGKPESFNFLGFTRMSGQSRKGRFQMQRRTIAQRFRAKLAEIKGELRR
jgi:RNA-directed DNA polymerase